MLLDSVIHYLHGRILVKGTGTDGDGGRTTTTKTEGQTDFPWQILFQIYLKESLEILSKQEVTGSKSRVSLAP